jgi:exodeoxyribonuclease VII large subunit
MTDVADRPGEAGNARPYTVSELATALKRTIEAAYGFVRLRGELSKVTRPASGHIYLDLKDDAACISGVVWASRARALSVRPEAGLEVVVTGKLTTYPGRSQYQIIIETMEPAGEGALLAQLERLKKKLAAEGLFAPERKARLPAMPRVIGVVTSPTGAVIHDILHRITDRWPCRVIVWPVVVQGELAAAQVRAAVEGFSALAAGGPVPRPDLIIVARGGGSVEDLWPFNDEALARAVAACTIPLVSAVGHETDFTLIDFVSDLRAPTPTAAAELTTPRLADIRAGLEDLGGRLGQAMDDKIDRRLRRLEGARLPRPEGLLAGAGHRLNLAGVKLGGALRSQVERQGRRLSGASARLRPGLLSSRLDAQGQRLERAGVRLAPVIARRLDGLGKDLNAHAVALALLEPKAPLKRGFALVRDKDGRLVKHTAGLADGQAIDLEFVDGHRGARVDGEPPFALSPPP